MTSDSIEVWQLLNKSANSQYVCYSSGTNECISYFIKNYVTLNKRLTLHVSPCCDTAVVNFINNTHVFSIVNTWRFLYVKSYFPSSLFVSVCAVAIVYCKTPLSYIFLKMYFSIVLLYQTIAVISL